MIRNARKEYACRSACAAGYHRICIYILIHSCHNVCLLAQHKQQDRRFFRICIVFVCVCVCFAIEGAKMMNWCFTHACPCPYKHGIAFCYCTIIIIICQLAPTTWTMPVPMRRRVAHCRTNTLIILLLLVRFIICNAIIIILLMFETHFDFIQEHKIYGFSYQTCIFEFSFLRRLPDLRIYRIAINTVFWPKLRLLAASHLPNIGKDLSHICAIWIMGMMVKLSALLHPKCATRLPQQIWIQ